MTELEATRLVGVLVAATSGWDDATITLYTAELMRLEDRQIAEQVVMRIIRTWTRPGRPYLGQIMGDYRAEADRQAQLRPQIQRQEKYPPIGDGLLIAWRAYAAECRANGKEPDRKLFGGFADRIPRDSTR